MELQAPDSESAERRTICVLFCDLVGSTRLSHELDPEDLRDLFAAYQNACAQCVVRYDGYVAQYLGDGVLIYLGYPRAHEDDALRTVLCGLDIIEAVHNLGERTARNEPLQVRLGAHTGRAVVGAIGSSAHQENLALGEAPNLAARIEACAEPGELVVSDALWNQVSRSVRGTSLGERQLKGISHPVGLWRVEARRDRASIPAAALRVTPLVGRDIERTTLETLWTEARRGEARWALLSGEAGIGKSRLLDAVRRRAAEDGGGVIELPCSPYAQDSPFHPVIEAVERHLDIHHGVSEKERLDRVARKLSELEIEAPGGVQLLAALLDIPLDERFQPLELSPVRRRALTVDLLVQLFSSLGDSRGLALLVEDLHWADASTVEFLDKFVAAAPAAPLFGLFTARTEFEHHWSKGPERLKLERLGAQSVEAIARSVAGNKALPNQVLGEIIQRCDGIPLFVEEVTRAVVEAGILKETPSTWELTGAPPSGLIPSTVEASLMARIDRLAESKTTAQLAATIGREFDYELLRVLSDRDDDELAGDLRKLVDSGLAWPTTGDARGSYAFKHALVRDAAYESLLKVTRQKYHRQIARVLEEQLPEIAKEQPELVALHLTGAGDMAGALEHWAEAGQRALGRTAVREAASHLQRAIECLESLPKEPRWLERELDLQLAIAPVLMAVYGWGSVEVEKACRRSQELATELGRPDKIYPALWGLWTVYFLRGEMRPAQMEADQVHAVAEQSGVDMLRITGRHATGYTYLYRGHFAEALEEADAGLALFDFEQERALVSTFQLSSSVALRATRATALWMLGRLREADDEWERMLALGRDLRHLPSLAAALAFALHGGLYRYGYVRELGKMTPVTEELLTLCKDEGFLLWYAVALTYHGAAIARDADADLAVRTMKEGASLFVQTGSRLTVVPMNVMQAEAFLDLGRETEAEALLDQAEREGNERDERLFFPEIFRVRGRIHAGRGESDAALACYDRAMAEARAQGALSLELRAALDRAEVLKRLDRRAGLEQSLKNLVSRFPDDVDHEEVVRARGLDGS